MRQRQSYSRTCYICTHVAITERIAVGYVAYGEYQITQCTLLHCPTSSDKKYTMCSYNALFVQLYTLLTSHNKAQLCSRYSAALNTALIQLFCLTIMSPYQ